MTTDESGKNGGGGDELDWSSTPALVAIRHEPNVQAFFDKLIGNQKAPMQAVVAVMRKLLHAIHGMLRNETDFDGAKFYSVG